MATAPEYMESRLFEVKLWHGYGSQGYKKWLTAEEPEILEKGVLKFTCKDGYLHIVTGSIEVSQLPHKPQAVFTR